MISSASEKKICIRCKKEFLGEPWREACRDCYEHVLSGSEFFTDTVSLEEASKHYTRGFFLWGKEKRGYYWFSPDWRCVLFPDKFHESQTLKQIVRKKNPRFTKDERFNEVVTLCRDAHKENGVWLTDEIIALFFDLFKRGRAYSIEAYDGQTLVGGLFGVYMNNCWSVESMFSLQSEMSKAALQYLCGLKEGPGIIDLQIPSQHLLTLGAEIVSRTAFLKLID